MKESKELELKSTITNTFLKTVSAFSNYNSGKIIFGIDDNGKIIGLENIEELRSKGKALVGNLKDYWRYRIGDYRLITKIDDGKLLIIALELKHSKEVYE